MWILLFSSSAMLAILFLLVSNGIQNELAIERAEKLQLENDIDEIINETIKKNQSQYRFDLK